MFSVYIYLGKYLLIPFSRYMRHPMFDFILYLEYIQTIKQTENPRLLYNNVKVI